MSREHDEFTHVIEAWLDTSEEREDPRTVLHRVVMQLDATPQRRFSWPAWRSPLMSNTVRIALAATAVIVAAFVGYRVGVAPMGAPSVGGPIATETLSPSPSSSTQVTPRPASDVLVGSFIGEGPHSVTVQGVSLSFRLPPGSYGWESHGRPYISKSTHGPQGAEAIIYWAGYPESLSAAPCTGVLNSSVGPSAADLAAAVASARGTELVSGPSDVTVGGRPALHVVLSVLRADYGCGPGFFYFWDPFDMGAMWTDTLAGDTITVWIVEVDGTRIFIAAETHLDAGERVQLEIQEIVDSIRFE